MRAPTTVRAPRDQRLGSSGDFSSGSVHEASGSQGRNRTPKQLRVARPEGRAPVAVPAPYLSFIRTGLMMHIKQSLFEVRGFGFGPFFFGSAPGNLRLRSGFGIGSPLRWTPRLLSRTLRFGI